MMVTWAWIIAQKKWGFYVLTNKTRIFLQSSWKMLEASNSLLDGENATVFVAPGPARIVHQLHGDTPAKPHWNPNPRLYH
jgi:hypothetical protein